MRRCRNPFIQVEKRHITICYVENKANGTPAPYPTPATVTCVFSDGYRLCYFVYNPPILLRPLASATDAAVSQVYSAPCGQRANQPSLESANPRWLPVSSSSFLHSAFLPSLQADNAQTRKPPVYNSPFRQRSDPANLLAPPPILKRSQEETSHVYNRSHRPEGRNRKTTLAVSLAVAAGQVGMT
jgi:hypothetical protein